MVSTLALTLALSGRTVLAGDAPAAGSDANWERAGTSLSTDASPDAESTNQVLEIPQACGDDTNLPCDSAPQFADGARDSTSHESSTDDDEDEEDIEVARRAAANHAPTSDDDTARAGGTPAGSDAGAVVEEYQSEPVYVAVPYPVAMYPYRAANPYAAATNRGPVNGNLRALPPSAYTIPPMAMSSPITQAARPPLSPLGSFMLRPR